MKVEECSISFSLFLSSHWEAHRWKDGYEWLSVLIWLWVFPSNIYWPGEDKPNCIFTLFLFSPSPHILNFSNGFDPNESIFNWRIKWLFVKQTQLQHLQKQQKTNHKTSQQPNLQITNFTLFHVVSLYWPWLSFYLCPCWVISVVWGKTFL